MQFSCQQLSAGSCRAPVILLAAAVAAAKHQEQPKQEQQNNAGIAYCLSCKASAITPAESPQTSFSCSVLQCLPLLAGMAHVAVHWQTWAASMCLQD
jgi:hypothetical protein